MLDIFKLPNEMTLQLFSFVCGFFFQNPFTGYGFYSIFTMIYYYYFLGQYSINSTSSEPIRKVIEYNISIWTGSHLTVFFTGLSGSVLGNAMLKHNKFIHRLQSFAVKSFISLLLFMSTSIIHRYGYIPLSVTESLQITFYYILFVVIMYFGLKHIGFLYKGKNKPIKVFKISVMLLVGLLVILSSWNFWYFQNDYFNYKKGIKINPILSKLFDFIKMRHSKMHHSSFTKKLLSGLLLLFESMKFPKLFANIITICLSFAFTISTYLIGYLNKQKTYRDRSIINISSTTLNATQHISRTPNQSDSEDSETEDEQQERIEEPRHETTEYETINHQQNKDSDGKDETLRKRNITDNKKVKIQSEVEKCKN